MKLEDMFDDPVTQVFVLTKRSDENELNWEIEPTDFELLPEDDNYYFVKAIRVSESSSTACFLGILIPDRLAEIVVEKNRYGQLSVESAYHQESYVIPAVASECFGIYELYYSKENPQIGIDVLRNGLKKARNKNLVAEDLGYILRDEGRIDEAIEAFEVSEENGPSSAYIYFELAGLYAARGQEEKRIEYIQKFKENGGIDI